MTIRHEMQIQGHKLVALAHNPDASGQPVILMHGITSSVHFWGADQLDLWREQGPCYALSLPGHYPAVLPPGFRQDALNAEMLVRVLTSAVRELVGDQAVTLVGHSTGGFAALAMASCTPEIVGRVVSISGFAQGRWTGTLGRNQRLARGGPLGRLIFKLISNLVRINRALFRVAWRLYVADKDAFYSYLHLEAAMDAMYPACKQLNLDAMIQYCFVMPGIDISDLLPRVAAPTLALAGDSDPIVPPAQSRLIAAKVPNADLVMIEGGGHILFAERPDEYRRALGDWLRKTKNATL